MNSQVKQIIAILFAAVLGGFFLAFFLIWYYGPTGQYKADQTMMSPEVIQRISFKDIHPKTGQNVKFIYDKTDFVFFDTVRESWSQKDVSMPAYQEFYQTIAKDKSVINPQEDVLRLFQSPNPTALVTTVRTDVSPAAIAFQVIQFTKEDYYRVKLHGHNEEGQWANFYHPGIYQKIMTIFGTTK